MLKNHRGIALVLPLIVFVVLGLALTYLVKWSNYTQNVVGQDAQVASYRNFVSSMRKAVYAGTSCSDLLNLGSASIPLNSLAFGTGTGPEENYYYPTPTNWGQSVNFHWNFGNYKGPIVQPPPPYKPEAMWKIPGGTTIFSVRLIVNGPIIRNNVRRDISGDPMKTARYGSLTAIPGHRGVNLRVGPNPDPNFVIPVLLYYENGSRRLVGCYDPNGPAAYCTNAGGAYNENMPISLGAEYRCNPDRTCKVGSNGVQTHSTCPPYYTAVRVAPGRWICQWCNRNP